LLKYKTRINISKAKTTFTDCKTPRHTQVTTAGHPHIIKSKPGVDIREAKEDRDKFGVKKEKLKKPIWELKGQVL
jgi:hypothetical protein